MKTMNLSDQAVGAVMMALQKSLLEQSDIVPVLKGFDFVAASEEEGGEAELYVKNPPLVKVDAEENSDGE
jgi:predicted TIM-barrel enzyme